MYSRLEENEKIEIEANVISSKESKKYYNKYVIETVYKKQKIKLYILLVGTRAPIISLTVSGSARKKDKKGGHSF